MRKPPNLIIFDCDGVLVDSELIFSRVLFEFLSAEGVDLSFEDCCALFIGKNKFAVERHMQAVGMALPPDWSDRFYAQVFKALGDEVVLIEGVREMLEALLGQAVPFCVASNGLIAKMQVTLGRTGLLPLFKDNMYSAYDIGASKPAPDVFLHAAKANGVAAVDCVVIEDSASGLQAAQAAGMTCFAYCPKDGDDAANLYGATPFRNMAELPALLGLA